jgi:hypothetical protein
MTEQDWQRVHRDTERAIEHMRRLIAIAEAGKRPKDKKANVRK